MHSTIRLRRKRFCGLPASRSPLIPHGVLLVDDQIEFLRVAAAVLAESPDLAVVGMATSGDEAISLAVALAPDIVVMDVQMPGLSGFETARRLRAVCPGIRIVMLSADGEPTYDAFARSSGAEAFLTKKQFLGAGLIGVIPT